MFVLDTNVLSAMMRSVLVPELAAWIAGQPEEELFTTAISQAEILAGLAVMPDGRRRAALEATVRAMFEDAFGDRILPFDTAAAAAYAEIFAVRRRGGRPIAPLDLTIAAIALAHDASVVTRDTRGFEGSGLTVINPWEVPG